MPPFAEPGKQQLGVARSVTDSQHSRDQDRQLVQSDQQLAAGIRQIRQTRPQLSRGVVPLRADRLCEVGLKGADLDLGRQPSQYSLDGAQEWNRLNGCPITRIGCELGQYGSYAVFRAVTTLDGRRE